MRSKLYIAIFCCIFIPIIALGQDISGSIEGYIVDTLGSPLTGVNILLESENLQGTLGAATNDEGYFRIINLPVGIYNVKISSIGYQKITFQNVQIQLGKTIFLGEIQLKSQNIDLPEVFISGNTLSIDPNLTVVGANLHLKDFERLPLDRNYRSVAALLPQANTSYLGDEINIAGATGGENKYFIDGIDATDSFLGSTGTNLPNNFVKEIEVKEGGYEAEFPGSLGGTLNVVTLSGSNEFHGSVSGFFTSNRFTANRKIGLLDRTQGGFSNYDFGLGIGGPLLRDKLWFYAAYNPIFAQSDVPVPDFGTALDHQITHSFAGKLTWRASQKLNFILMTTGDPTEWHAVGEGIAPSGLVNPDPYFSDQKHGGVNLSVHGAYTPKEGLLFETSLSRSTSNGVWEGSTDVGRNEILFENGGNNGIWSGGLGFRVNRFIYSNVFNFGATIVAGYHTLKAGFQFKETGVNEDDQGKRIIEYNDSSYELQQDQDQGTVKDNIPSIYFQDNWRIFQALRLNLGLRWDNQYIIASTGKVGQKFTNEFQPRVGIIFLPAKDESQKLFVSYGRFYQELSTALSENYSNQRYAFSIFYNHDPRLDPSGGVTNYSQSIAQPEISGLRGQYYDEINLGYQRLIYQNLKISIEGIYRTLGEAVEDVYLFTEDRLTLGNPGSGELNFLPKAKRDYTALVFTIQERSGDRFNFLASYTLSRNYGNYSGLYDAYHHWTSPNGIATFDYLNDNKLATGLLPNDRTHVFKLSGSYHFDFGLNAGVFFTWQSGTPITEMASYAFFIARRSAGGETRPSIWDLNLHFDYDLSYLTKWQTKFIVVITSM